MYRVRPRSAALARPGRPGPWAWGTFAAVRTLSCSSALEAPDNSKVSSNPAWKAPRTIAVLGGGLTGLTTACYLSRFLPKTKITVFEASNRLGGWIDTETVPVTTPDGHQGTVAFERGARVVQSYRPGTPKFDDMVFYEMVEMLRLQSQLLKIPKKSPLKPFIYYPDHIVEMPSPGNISPLDLIRKLWSEPLFKGVVSAFHNYMKTSASPLALRDTVEGRHDIRYIPSIQSPVRDQQSLGQYWSRWTGNPELVDNVLSAMIHGIWGGDIFKLSDARDPFNHKADRPTLPPSDTRTLLTNEEFDLPHVMGGFEMKWDPAWTLDAQAYSHLCFKNGFSTLTAALVADLQKNPMVTIRTNQPVSSLRLHASEKIAVFSEGQQTEVFENVVSTMNANTLASITGNELPSLAESRAVTIQAVNLWYPTPMLNAPYRGFGYLIPKTVDHSLNPECALGVLFDSDREAIAGYSPDTVPGTKLTVLLGGHYWDDLPAGFLPNSGQAIDMAKAVVARHLGIPQHENDRAVASTKLCKECIPQHSVGHWDRMTRARTELQRAFAGKLAVAGPSYQMPGVLGSMRAARDLASYLAGHYPIEDKFWLSPVGDTGLDRFANPVKWVLANKKALPMRYPKEYLESFEGSRSAAQN